MDVDLKDLAYVRVMLREDGQARAAEVVRQAMVEILVARGKTAEQVGVRDLVMPRLTNERPLH